MKNLYKYNTNSDYAILFCPTLSGETREVTIDREFLKIAQKVDGLWREMENPLYPSEPYRTTIATIYKGKFIDMKRVIVGLEAIE